MFPPLRAIFLKILGAIASEKRAAGAKILRFGVPNDFLRGKRSEKAPKIGSKYLENPQNLENPPLLRADLENHRGFRVRTPVMAVPTLSESRNNLLGTPIKAFGEVFWKESLS